MDNVDWILIIILVVVCAIFLVWFGSWLCRGSAPEHRVQGQGERSRGSEAAATAMTVFDYFRPRAKVAASGGALLIGGAETPMPTQDQLEKLINGVNPTPSTSEDDGLITKVVTKVMKGFMLYDDKTGQESLVLSNGSKTQVRDLMYKLVSKTKAQIINKGLTAVDWPTLYEILSTPKPTRKNAGTVEFNDFKKQIDDLIADYPESLLELISTNSDRKNLDDATAKIAELSSKIQAHIDNIAKLKDQSDTLATEKTAAIAESSKAQKTLSDAVAERDDAQKKLSAAEGELQKASSEKAVADAEVLRLTKELNAATQKISAASSDASATQGEIAALRQQIEALQAEKAQVESQSVAALAAAKVSADAALVAAKVAADAAAESDKAAAKAAMETAQKTHEQNIEAIKAQHKTQADALDARIADLTTKLGTANAVASEKDAKIAELTASLNTLQQSLDAATQTAAANQTTMDGLTRKLYEAQQLIGTGEQVLADKTKELEARTAQVKQLEESLGATNAARDQSHKVLEELLVEVQSIVQTMGSLRSEMLKEVDEVRGRIDHIDVEKTVDRAKLAAIHTTLSAAATPEDFEKLLANSMVSEPFHTTMAMVATDVGSLQDSYAKLANSLKTIEALEGVVKRVPPNPSKGLLNFLSDMFDTTTSEVSDAITNLHYSIKQDQLSIAELKTKISDVQTKLDAMDLKVTAIDARVAKLETDSKAVASAATVADLQKEIDYLKQEMENSDDNYEDVYIMRPPVNDNGRY